MRVLITGGSGFVARWLEQELSAGSHEVIALGHERLDVTDAAAVTATIRAVRPDAIAHLAAIASPRAVDDDPAAAIRATIGGTIYVLEAAAQLRPSPAILIPSSAEVYAVGPGDDAPIHESRPLGPRTTYGLTKAAEEGVAHAIAKRSALRVAIARSFNHTGPGQSATYAVPAFATRLREVMDGRATSIRVGNLGIRRDLSDVRDVARAYRLLIERLAALDRPDTVVANVASGVAVTMRSVLDLLFAAAGRSPDIVVDPHLVRPNEPQVICGDPARIRDLTGWSPHIPLVRTITDVWAAVLADEAASSSV